MVRAKKDRVIKEGAQKKAKKEYETPRLIIYGTVANLTDAKTPGGADGKNARLL